MGEQRQPVDGIPERGAGTTLKRRGILAAAGAVVAGLVAKQTAHPVAAAAPMLIADTSTPVINTIHGQTNLTGDVPTGQTVLVADARPSGGNAFGFFGYGKGTFAGVGGSGETNGVGVFGGANGFSGKGVSGSSDLGNGVYGLSNSGYGVFGNSTSGTGVLGSSFRGNGVYGFAGSAGTTFTTVGVYGFSDVTYGVLGSTTAPGYSGLTGVTSTPGVAALATSSTVPTAYAAYFTGTTVVQGNFVAFGGSKSAAVPDASGQYRLVYCVESPEAWFEDFGTGHLANGKASVALDPTFAAIVHTNDYHVFLTPYDPANKGLAVSGQSAAGFTVQELHGGASNGAFRWRVVAKRKDVAGERLAQFDVPKINHPDPDKLPKPEPPPRKP